MGIAAFGCILMCIWRCHFHRLQQKFFVFLQPYTDLHWRLVFQPMFTPQASWAVAVPYADKLLMLMSTSHEMVTLAGQNIVGAVLSWTCTLTIQLLEFPDWSHTWVQPLPPYQHLHSRMKLCLWSQNYRRRVHLHPFFLLPWCSYHMHRNFRHPVSQHRYKPVPMNLTLRLWSCRKLLPVESYPKLSRKWCMNLHSDIRRKLYRSQGEHLLANKRILRCNYQWNHLDT